jgi:hypothetical protein
MKLFVITVTLFSLAAARPQQNTAPTYLQQYYQQAPQQGKPQATPIFEQAQHEAEQQQYLGKEEQGRQQAYVAPSVRQYQQQQAQQAQQIQYSLPPQQQLYKPGPPKQTLAARRPQPQFAPQQQSSQRFQKEDLEDEEYAEPQSYQFGFDVKDDEFTNYQNRKEVKDGNVIKGSYSVVDSDGFIRTVTYTADPKEGFKAEVVREPTDIVIKIPKPHQQPQGKLQNQYQAASPQQYRQQQQKQPQQAQQAQNDEYEYQ